MKKSTTSDGLITDADVGQLKTEIDAGAFKAHARTMAAREPALAAYLSERYRKTHESLSEAGLDGRRLAALHRHISLLMWGASLLLWRAHRRSWDGFLPVDTDDGASADKPRHD